MSLFTLHVFIKYLCQIARERDECSNIIRSWTTSNPYLSQSIHLFPLTYTRNKRLETPKEDRIKNYISREPIKSICLKDDTCSIRALISTEIAVKARRGFASGVHRKRIRKSGMVAYSDAVAIIGDLDELEAAVLDDNGDGGGACVEAVLHELLHRRDRPLDDLPSRNPVNHWLVKPPDPRRLGHAGGPRRDGLAHRHRRDVRFSDLHRPSTVPGFQVIRLRGFGV